MAEKKLTDFTVFELIRRKITAARNKYPPFLFWVQAHDVILDEFLGFRESLKDGKPDPSEMLSVAAMAFQAIKEICEEACQRNPEKFAEVISRGMDQKQVAEIKKLLAD